MINDRFKDADWLPIEEPVLVVGAGGIGSPLIVDLIGMGVPALVVYDFDDVELANVGTQFHFHDKVGAKKVVSLQNTIEKFYGRVGPYIPIHTTYDGSKSPYMFCAVDNMKARREMFEVWKEDPARQLFIDGRIAAESCWVYAVQKGEEDLYEEHYLLNDDDIPDESCTWKATRHIGGLCAGFMIANYTNFLTNRKLGVEVRSVNFRTEYQIPLNYVIVQSSTDVSEKQIAEQPESIPA